MAGYTRQSSFSDGDTITAALFNNEYNQLVNAFNVSSGHTHDGSTTGDGGPISTLFSNTLSFGTNAESDIAITFNAASNDGVLTWKEDEDYFEFSDDLLIATTEKIQFRDTAIYINSSTDGQLDLVADTEIQIAATTVDINGNADISGNLGIGGNLTVTGTTTFNGGTITMGDAATDNVVFGADVDSNIIPDDDNTYDLGSSSQEWKDLYVDGIAYLDGINFNGTAITSTAAELNILDGVTASTSDLNILDGVTATTTELNKLDGVTASATDINLIDGITNGTVIASKAIITDSNKDITGGRNITISGQLAAATLDISGDVDVDGTLEADAITVNGTTLAETISDTVGAMVTSNTETGVTVTYDDSDNTLDFVIGTLNQDTTGTAALATTVTVSANNSTDETIFPVFVDGATGTQGLETDTGFTYNPSTGLLTATGFSGNLTGTLQTAAQTNITSVGTLSALSVGSTVTINNTASTSFGALEMSGTSGAFIDLKSPSSDDFDLRIISAGTGGQINAASGTVALQVAGSNILSATSSGVEITGTLSASGNITGTLATAAQTNITSVGTLTGLTTTGDINLGDSDKVIFGAGDDLEIYHDGSNSLISEAGVGNLIIRGSDNVDIQPSGGGAYMGRFAASGAVELYHNGSKKLETTSSGVDVTGTLTATTLAGTLSTAAQTNITSVGTLTTLTVDDITINGSTISDSGDLTIDVGGDLYLDAAGDDVHLSQDGTHFGKFKRNSSNLEIHALLSDGDTVFKGNDGGSTITALTLDMSDAGKASFLNGFRTTGTSHSIGSGLGTDSASLEIGPNRTDSGNAFIDLVGDTTYTDYGARFIRANDGANTTTSILHRGTGGLQLKTQDAGAILLSTSNTERMRIDSSGNVGIGTTSPGALLTVNDGNDSLPTIGGGTKAIFAGDNTSGFDTAISILANDEAVLNFGDYADENIGMISYLNASDAMTFTTNASERMRLDSSGVLMIGTTDSTQFNNTSGSGIAIHSTEIQVASTNNCLALNHSDGDGDIAKFFRGGTQVGGITVASSSTTFATSSDARLKDVTGSARGLEVINELNPVAYNWKVDGKADEGLIAQEVKELVPNAVNQNDDDYYQMDYSKLVVHLVAGMKEQQEQIKALQSEINELKNS